MEHFPYSGESPADRLAFSRYVDEIKRGKNLLQLMAVRDALTPDVKQSWSPRSFTPIMTTQGMFDAVTCNISYHFQKHGSRYKNIAAMTAEARKYFQANRSKAVVSGGLVKFDKGIFEPDGRIVTFY